MLTRSLGNNFAVALSLLTIFQKILGFEQELGPALGANFKEVRLQVAEADILT